MSFEDMIFAEMNGHTVEEDDRYIRGYNQALEEFVKLIENEMPYDICDGNEAIEEIKKVVEQLKERK